MAALTFSPTGGEPRPFHFEKSIDWNCRKPSGGSVPSRDIGISLRASRPNPASSRTQADCTESADHSTMTASLSFSAFSISDEKLAPPPMSSSSRQTSWPSRSSHSANRCARAASLRE